MITQQLTTSIAERYCGPPESGNGGYTCGVVATGMEGAVEVTLLKPPPLDTQMHLDTEDDLRVLRHQQDVVAQARATSLELDVPDAPTFEEALASQPAYWGFEQHAFPTCFVCGPDRAEGDGLRIFPARAAPDAPAVAAWIPDPSVCDSSGRVLREIVWAALDCPGYFGVAQRSEPALLGRMTAAVRETPRGGDRCVIVGWAIGREGRKLYAGSALYAPGDELIALSKQTWIRLGG